MSKDLVNQSFLIQFPSRIELIWPLGFASLFLFAQLVMGTNFWIIMANFYIFLFGFYGVHALGLYNAGAWLLMIFVINNSYLALIAKTFLRQPLDSFLFSPIESFLILMVGTFDLLCALLAVNFVRVGKPIFEPLHDPNFLKFLSRGCFFLGTVSWGINNLLYTQITYQSRIGETAFGGLAVFFALLYMATIARTGALLVHSRGAKSLNLEIVLFILCTVLMGLLDNSKIKAGMPFVAWWMTILFFKNAVSIRQLFGTASAMLIILFILGPSIHLYRAHNILGMPFSQRVEYFVKQIPAVFSQNRTDDFQLIRQLRSHYDYFGGERQMFLGRFASIQQIDPVINVINKIGPQGGQFLWPGILKQIPKLIYPDKPIFPESYRLLASLGLISRAGGVFPTVPLLGQAYATYGLPGVILVPFITFFVFLLLFKKLGWALKGNVFAIFFLVYFVLFFSAQGSFGQYWGAILRNFPVLAIVFIGIKGLYFRVNPS